MKIRKRKRDYDELPRGGKMRMAFGEEDLPDTKRKKTFRQIERENGGAGVFHFNLREHWKLENPVWKNDEIPEFYVGRNVADYYHPGIASDLKALEAEEAKIEAMLGASSDEEIPLPAGMKHLTQDQKYLVKEIRHRRLVGRMVGNANKTKNHPIVTRSRRKRTVEDLGEHLEERGLNPFVAEDRIEDRAEAIRVRSSKRMAVLMGPNEGVTTKSRHPFARARSRRSNEVKGIVAKGLVDLEQTKKAKKMHDKAFKEMRAGSKYKVTASDRHIDSPAKHMLTGKRGIGKTDYR